MAALIRWFLHSRVAANLLMAAIVAAGVASLFNITVRTFPEIATGAVTVTVSYPGASPAEVADAVLTPIEEQLQGLEGVRELQSTASRGVGTVTAELITNADVGAVKDDIETAVARITTFPDAALQPRVAEVEPTELAIELVLYGDAPRATLKALAQQVRRDLTDRQGISQVDISGVPTDQIDIAVSRQTLENYRVGLTDLAERIRSGNLDLSAGRIDTDQSDFQVRSLGEAQTADAFRQKVLFTGENGAQVTLGEVAQVSDAFAESSVRATVSEQNAVFVAVNRAGTEQVLNIVDQVQTYLETELQQGLPEDVTAAVWQNSGEQLQGRIDLLAKNGAIGAALILTVLLLFLDLRVAAWVAAGVVITFAGVFAPMQIFGTTINQLSLFGFILALGIVVDDAIVVGENVYSELEREGASADGAAERGVLRVWRPILFSVTTTILAFIPLLFLPSSSGSFIGPVAAVVIYVLALSLVESFLVLPKHLSHIRLNAPRRYSPRRLTEAIRTRVDAGFKAVTNGPLCRIVEGSIRHPVFVVVLCVAGAIMAGSLVAGGVVRFVFFPQIEGNLVTAELRMPEGTSDAETMTRARQVSDAARVAAEEIGAESELLNTSVTIGFSTAESGGGESGTSVQTGNVARVTAKLADANTRETAAQAFTNAWRDATGEVAGARELLFSSSLIGVGSDILLEVSAETEENRDAAVERIRNALQRRDGVRDLRDDRASSAQEITITRTDAAAVYNVPLATIANEVRASLYGVTIEQFARDQEEIDVRVRMVEDHRDSVADLLKLDITTPEGRIPLPVLANISFEPAATSISRVNGRTVTTIRADVDNALTTGGAETTWVMDNIVNELQRDYPGVTVSTGGEQEEAGRFSSSLAGNFLLAVFGIYAVLALAFSSYLRPFIVLGMIPFGVAGAIVAHAAMGLNLTMLSMFGIIGLSGVVVNGALLIVDFIQEAEANGDSPGDAILTATLSRFRPIVLTTMTTFLGISPLIFETSVQAQFLIPTAVSLGFGILFVSILQMVLVPAFAALYASGRSFMGRKKPAAN